jgi:hypothetical protein
MFSNRYVDGTFADYLNRYVRGTIVFREKLAKIRVYFTVSEAFSNHACRFYIRVKFHNPEELSSDERRLAYECFHDHINGTGYEFVSFVYQGNRDHHIDAETIRLFIFHYLFASNIFQGAVKPLLRETCTMEIAPLSDEPFFNYIDAFLGNTNVNSEGFGERYFAMKNRHFHFDRRYHERLLAAAANSNPISQEDAVTDRALSEAGAGDREAIRRFVLDKKISIRIGYDTDVINEIYINQTELHSAIKNYRPDYTAFDTSRLYPIKILSFIAEKESKAAAQRAYFQKSVMEAGITTGDVVLFQKSSSYGSSQKQDVGIVKRLYLNYHNELQMTVQLLKNDLSEGKLTVDSVELPMVVKFITGNIFADGGSISRVKTKNQLIGYIKTHGKRTTKAIRSRNNN